MVKGDVFIYKATLTPAAAVNATAAFQTFTVTGLLTAYHVPLFVSKAADQTGLTVTAARVSADNEIKLQFTNATAATITPTAAEVYTFVIADVSSAHQRGSAIVAGDSL
jgi:hypothetical protein